MLKELLKKYLVEDGKVNSFLDEMKASKIFTASEENLDTRYNQLKGKMSAKEQEHQEALNLIEQMKQASAGQDALQSKITEYETTIASLQAKNTQLARENSLKVALLSNKAKGDDIDYLMFKLSQDENALKVDEEGAITNIDEVINGLKTNYPTHFEAGAKKKVEVTSLPSGDDKKETITKEQFNAMSYNQRNELYNSNKALYQELSKGE